MTIWMDMTFSMRTRKGQGIVGISRVELELASKLHKLDDSIRYFVVEKDGFYELIGNEISWLFTEDNIGEAYEKHFPRKPHSSGTDTETSQGLENAKNYYGRPMGKLERLQIIFSLITKHSPIILRWIPFILFKILFWLAKLVIRIKDYFMSISKKKVIGIDQTVEKIPFSNDDLIFSAGFMHYTGVKKEYSFSELRCILPDIKIIYVVYDLVYLNKNTDMIYPLDQKMDFINYLNWISLHCDYVLYGGETAKSDAEKYYIQHDLRIPPGKAIRFGSEIGHTTLNAEEVKKKLQIKKDYILSVGSIDTKKNYEVLYKAYYIAETEGFLAELPDLVIIGSEVNVGMVSDYFELTPNISDKVHIYSANDNELEALYQNCLFFVLPTWYEGWSLTLPEALNHGKMCIVSDISPLREIAGSLSVYCNPADAKSWANNILKYSRNTNDRLFFEESVKKEWKNISWDETASMVYQTLTNSTFSVDKNITFDITTTQSIIRDNADVAGIVRTELTLLRYLCRIYPHMRVFSFENNNPRYINRQALEEILGNIKIDTAYKNLKTYMIYYHALTPDNEIQSKPSRSIYWLICSLLPLRFHKPMIKFAESQRLQNLAKQKNNYTRNLPFSDNELLLSVGTGFTNSQYGLLDQYRKTHGIKIVQLLYDFTPFSHPQFHDRRTIDHYQEFVKNVYNTSSYILYGGRTAQIDGEKYARQHKYPLPKSAPVFFGSDDVGNDQILLTNEEENDEMILKKFGIKGKYVLAVGTLQPRKNYETLYLAYVEMLKHHIDVPQMVFAGFHGWKMDEFVGRVNRDNRVHGKLLIITPNDKEMDILYRNCEFTTLASIYEGWSLTLPESLNRGKFCLCTDTPPLKETAGEFSDYIEGYDVNGWAEKIYYYYNNKLALSEKERLIRDKWHTITWRECAEQISSIINEQIDA